MLSRELQGTAAWCMPEELHYPFCEPYLPQIRFSVNVTTNWEFEGALDHSPTGHLPAYCTSTASQAGAEGSSHFPGLLMTSVAYIMRLDIVIRMKGTSLYQDSRIHTDRFVFLQDSAAFA